MVAKKTTDLPQKTSLADDDLLYVASDPSGTPTSVSATVATLRKAAGGSMPYNVGSFGAIGDGVTDDKAAIQSAIDAAGANSTVFFPDGTYVISGPLLVENDYVQIHLSGGATLIAKDVGAYTLLEIDNTKVGMPQMKTMVAFRDCTGSSLIGGGTIDAENLLFESGVGSSGVFVRNCTRVVVDGVNVKNVWPSALINPGGSGDSRYTGILFLKSTSCVARNNQVDHCNYDGIAARMQNEDIHIENNKCWDCFEGIQSSKQYGTVTPLEDNTGTHIINNEVFDCYAQLIVFHSDDVHVRGNHCHTPKAGTQGIRAIGANEGSIVDNLIVGIDDTTTAIETHDFDAIRAGVTNSSLFANNTIQFANNAITFSTNVVFYPVVTNNIIWKCNTGIDVRDIGTATRDRRCLISNNFIRAYRYGVRAQDTGPTLIVNNIIQEQAGWVGSSIGLDLDPESNGDTEYVVKGSMPINFTTQISLPSAPIPPTSDYLNFIGQDTISAADRYYNRGELTVSSGNTTGTDNLQTGLSITPGPGEIQVTQTGGPPVAFRWSATTTTLTVTIASSQGSDCTFGWTMHLAGFVKV